MGNVIKEKSGVCRAWLGRVVGGDSKQTSLKQRGEERILGCRTVRGVYLFIGVRCPALVDLADYVTWRVGVWACVRVAGEGGCDAWRW